MALATSENILLSSDLYFQKDFLQWCCWNAQRQDTLALSCPATAYLATRLASRQIFQVIFMDNYEKWGYLLLAIVAVAYVLAMLAGMIVVFPFGLLGLLLMGGFGILLIKVVKERLHNKEDDYYSKEIDK
ncbi:MAG: hypothetical protein R3F53_04365 [Gammaproteobacteria bacterium]